MFLNFLKKLFGFEDKRVDKKQTNEKAFNANNKLYRRRKYFMTSAEKELFQKIKNVVGNEYIVLPQINLATVVEKVNKTRYHNELFRNIDFCIFTQDYEPKILIELNDNSHHFKNRRIRDDKVNMICSDAGLPVLTLWSNYPNEEKYIKQRLDDFFNKIA